MLCCAIGNCAGVSTSVLGAQTDEVSSVADAAEAKRRWRAQQDDATFPDEVCDTSSSLLSIHMLPIDQCIEVCS